MLLYKFLYESLVKGLVLKKKKIQGHKHQSWILYIEILVLFRTLKKILYVYFYLSCKSIEVSSLDFAITCSCICIKVLDNQLCPHQIDTKAKDFSKHWEKIREEAM